MPEPHERLDEAMNQRRLELRMNWREVAQAADISYEALRGIRRGDYRPTELTARGLDDALRWEHGSVLAILNGGEPTPVSEDAPAPQSPLSSRELEILQDLIDSTVDKLGLTSEEAQEAFRRALEKIEGRRAAAAKARPEEPPEASQKRRTG